MGSKVDKDIEDTEGVKMRNRDELIEDITAELRLGFVGRDVVGYFRELADRIEAAHVNGVIKAIEELKSGD